MKQESKKRMKRAAIMSGLFFLLTIALIFWVITYPIITGLSLLLEKGVDVYEENRDFL